MDKDELSLYPPSSHLFTVRVWLVAGQQGQPTVRIQAKHVLSGDIYSCHTWSELAAFLQARVSNPKAGTIAGSGLE